MEFSHFALFLLVGSMVVVALAWLVARHTAKSRHRRRLELLDAARWGSRDDGRRTR
jgi:hypothetical protein